MLDKEVQASELNSRDLEHKAFHPYHKSAQLLDGSSSSSTKMVSLSCPSRDMCYSGNPLYFSPVQWIPSKELLSSSPICLKSASIEMGWFMSAKDLPLLPFKKDKTDSSSDQEVKFYNLLNEEELMSIETLVFNIRCVNQNLLMLSP